MLAKLGPESGRESNANKNIEEERSVGNLNMLGHYNLAIELEYLKRYEESIEEFTKAKEWAKKLGKKNTGIIIACDESIDRMRSTMNHLKDKLIRIVTKRRVDEERGFYSYMRKNKKNFSSKAIQTSHGSLPKNIKALKLYEEKPAHYRTKSIMRLKTSPKEEEGPEGGKNRNTSFSYL